MKIDIRNTTDQEILDLIGGNSEYWNTENSNKDAKIVTTQRDYLAGITSKDIARRYILPKDLPRWEKATQQHNVNPMLGRGAWSN